MGKTLTNELRSALEKYSNARAKHREVRQIVEQICSAFFDQKATRIADCDTRIARLARLWQWQPRPGFGSLFFGFCSSIAGRTKTDRQLLRSTPGVELLFVFHRNGYLREEALDRISGPLPNSFVAAALVWRLNDWVEEVRKSAARCLARCLPKTSADVIAKFHLETIHVQQSWRRWSATEKELLRQQLDRPDVARAIASRLMDEREGPLPSALASLLRYDFIDAQLVKLAGQSNLPGVRAIALRTLVDGHAQYADGWEWQWVDKPMGIRTTKPRLKKRPIDIEADRKSLLLAGVSDKSAVVRRVALSGIIEHHLSDDFALEVARQSLEDPSASVRSRAEFIVKRATADLD